MIPLSLAFTLAMLSLNVALYLTLKTFTAPFYKGTQKLKLPCLKTEDSL